MRSVRYENPVYSGYLADPFVFFHDGSYFAVGTGADEAAGSVETSRAANVFPVLRSNDLATWVRVGRALVRPETSLGDTFWAPEIAWDGAFFYLYYSVGFADARHQLRVATSRFPQGPYEDTGIGLTDLDQCSFAIDPHPFRDRDGKMYLFHARDFLDSDEASSLRAGTALVVAELATMTKLSNRVVPVLRAHFEWQRFLRDRAMYGSRYDWHTLEGPCVRERDGKYYCMYSGGRWESAEYGVDFAVADTVSGPYSDAGGEDGPRVLRSKPGVLVGPGHHSVVFGPDGRTEYLAYHAWDPGFEARRLCIDPLIWTPAGPRADGPSREPRRLALRA
jgi:beta-xylosidase